MKLKFRKLDPRSKIQQYAHDGDSGMDSSTALAASDASSRSGTESLSRGDFQNIVKTKLSTISFTHFTHFTHFADSP